MVISGIMPTRYSEEPVNLRSIAYGNGVYVAVGDKSDPDGFADGVVYKSVDGVTWTYVAGLGTDVSLCCIAFGNGTFVAAGNALAYHSNEPHVPIWISQDGVSWTPVKVPIDNDSITGLAYGENLFAATTIVGRILSSPDGATWTVRKPSVVPFPSTYLLDGITYGNNTFVVVGGSSRTFNVNKLFDNGVALISNDGVNWSSQSPGVQDLLVGISYGNNTFAAVSAGGIIIKSSNGKSWTSQRTGTQDLNQVAYGNNTFVIVGETGNKGMIIKSGVLP
jgi:hypothetical protein